MRIQPLTRDRLAEYFEGTGRGPHGVRAMLTSDPELLELLDSPLMLNIMALAVQGADGEQLRAEDTTAARRELFDAYVCEVLARRVTPPSRYTPRETVRALWCATTSPNATRPCSAPEPNNGPGNWPGTAPARRPDLPRPGRHLPESGDVGNPRHLCVVGRTLWRAVVDQRRGELG
ncbi:hypothetical protein AB0L13_03710 [Saccharopolyspora shandongensis]|uniref:hypothetical protein n=1 Tax=Saccharopolyspora shandongensis TaxID=418495 RepID=UPI0034379DD5